MGEDEDRDLQQLFASSCQARAFDEKSYVARLLYSVVLIQHVISNLCLLRQVVSLYLTTCCWDHRSCSLLCISIGCQLLLRRPCFPRRLF